MKPHKHAEVIKAWADGASIECFDKDDGDWAGLATPFFWSEYYEYRIKPAEPEKAAKEYPVTNYKGFELYDIYLLANEKYYKDDLLSVANAAIRRAIDDGQVVIASELEHKNDWHNRYERDMSVAIAVIHKYNLEMHGDGYKWELNPLYNTDWIKSVIASIK